MLPLQQRYSPEAVLMGTVRGVTGKGWSGQWRLVYAGRQIKLAISLGNSRDQVLQQAMQNLSQQLAAEYALSSVAPAQDVVLISVDAVEGLNSHLKVQKYLQSLDAISSVRLGEYRAKPDHISTWF